MGEKYGNYSFGVTERYLEKNDKTWLPVMGEMHFTRYCCEDWETELKKMKACGVNIIATYLFWIFHEEVQGTFNFSGNRNIAGFLELCKKHGLYAFVRIGPWSHGECRNGGFPDWLMQTGLPLRCRNEEYLALVRKLFMAYADEIKPWLFENGGPVIGMQIENELENDADYLAEVKKIALEWACMRLIIQ